MKASNFKGVRNIFLVCVLSMTMLMFNSAIHAATDIKSGQLNIQTGKKGHSVGRLMLGNQLLMRSWAYFSLKNAGKTYSAGVLSFTKNGSNKEKAEEITCTKSFPKIGYKHTVSIKKVENGFKIVIESFFSKECVAPYIYIHPLLSWEILDGAKYEIVDENDNVSKGVISPLNGKRTRKIPFRTNMKEIKFQLKTGGTLTFSFERNNKSTFLQYLSITPKKNEKCELRLKLFQGNEEQLFPKGYNGRIEILIKYEK